jgi:hypothetical protein
MAAYLRPLVTLERLRVVRRNQWDRTDADKLATLALVVGLDYRVGDWDVDRYRHSVQKGEGSWERSLTG